MPTSGSTGARKLIPFTAGSQREFNAAIGPWLTDTQRKAPGILGRPAYWSVTPVLRNGTAEESAVPIGFDADTAYLGGARRRLVEAALAVPHFVQRSESLEAFRYQTLLHLLRCGELRLISVWHPSFLTLLLEALPEHWEDLMIDIARGAEESPVPLPRRANELRETDPRRPATIWPELRVISCWGDGGASFAAEDLGRRFPTVSLQPKGLIATEAFVTLPFAGQHPLAIESHFFEFIDAESRVLPVEALHEGEDYEVVVTTGGGLWRYRLGDRVRVTGWVENTPALKFLGRTGDVSDRYGEKLSGAFVGEVLREVFGGDTPRFAMLAPDEDTTGCRYTLFIEGTVRQAWAEVLDRGLRRNPNYAYCRGLGQLLPARVFVIDEQGFETYARRQARQGARLGDIKPAVLSRTSGWSNVFLGGYLNAVSAGMSMASVFESEPFPTISDSKCGKTG